MTREHVNNRAEYLLDLISKCQTSIDDNIKQLKVQHRMSAASEKFASVQDQANKVYNTTQQMLYLTHWLSAISGE